MTGFLESWSLQLCNDTKMSSQLQSFYIVTSIVYYNSKISYMLLRNELEIPIRINVHSCLLWLASEPHHFQILKCRELERCDRNIPQIRISESFHSICITRKSAI